MSANKPSPPLITPFSRFPSQQVNDLARYSSVQQLATAMQPYFLSSSLGTAPGAKGSNGNRTTVLTSQSQQTIVGNLVAGVFPWKFSPAFKSVPIVNVTPIGAPPSAGTTLYISSVSATGVTITSTSGSDARSLHLTAFANPS
jgi:hypothetical protein